MPSIKSAAMLAAALIVSGCSTATWVKLPKDSALVVNERPVLHNQGLVKTRPFSWGAAATCLIVWRTSNPMSSRTVA